jgi:hypothetical protein
MHGLTGYMLQDSEHTGRLDRVYVTAMNILQSMIEYIPYHVEYIVRPRPTHRIVNTLQSLAECISQDSGHYC